MYRIFLIFAKSCILSTLLKIKGVLAGHNVAMITYSAMKMRTTCLPMIQQFTDTMIVVSIDNDS